MSEPSPIQCGVASLLIPGLGHLLRRRWSRGLLQLGAALVCGAMSLLTLEALGYGPGWLAGFRLSIKGHYLLWTLIPMLALAWLYAAHEAYEAALREDRKTAGADPRARIRERRRRRLKAR